MKILNKIKLSVVVSLFLLIGCVHTHSHYYSNYFKPETLSKIQETTVIINSVAERENGEIIKTRAVGFHIGNGYIVALKHATYDSFVICINIMPFGMHCEKVIDIAKRTYLVNDEEIEYIGYRDDIILFHTDREVESFPFGNSDELEVGTKIAVVGYSHAIAINVKTGIVFDPEVDETYNMSFETEDDILPLSNLFAMTVPLNPGDSGSQILSYHNGNAEIVGIACMMLTNTQCVGFAYSSNYLQETVEKIKKGD